jgi:hypothetical protein
LRILSQWREAEKEKWADGTLTTPDHFATAIKNAEAIGRCQTCNDVLTMQYEGFIGELGYDEPSSK